MPTTLLPSDDLLDDNGYPTTEALSFIRHYAPTEEEPIDWFVSVLKDMWWNADRQFKYDGKNLVLHTGGWSGNENIVEALLENVTLCAYLDYLKWEKGGAYYFVVRK